MRIAFATCVDKPEGTTDDLVWKNHLVANGHQVHSVPWSATHENWSDFDLVIIRSTWDYHKHLSRFLKWAEDVSKVSKLINPLATVKWNSNKKYLLELPIESRIQSFISKDKVSLVKQANKMLSEFGQIILKPTVSATADLTFKVSNPLDIPKSIDQILVRGEVILQQYISSITEDGEISLVYLNDNGWKYSHAVRKIGKPGDFRVQVEFGGTVENFDCGEKHQLVATSTLQNVAAGSLYARVDLVDWKTAPKIGELEMIEPQLFFPHSDSFAEKLTSRIQSLR